MPVKTLEPVDDALKAMKDAGVIRHGEPFAAYIPAFHQRMHVAFILAGAGHEADDLGAEFATALADAAAGVAPLEFEAIRHQVHGADLDESVGKFRQER